MALDRVISDVRAFTLRGGGADYHDQGAGHWIDDHIATPMSVYPEYRQSRQSFGINVLGTLVVEIEADDGTVGFSVTTAGEIGAFIVERHLSRFLLGAKVTDIERIWDQMYKSTLYYGRKGVVLNTISDVDLALYDLLGRLRGEPVYALLGGPVRDELTFMPRALGPTRPRTSGSSAGRCRCITHPQRAAKGSRRTSSCSRTCARSATTFGSCTTAGCRWTWTTPPGSRTARRTWG